MITISIRSHARDMAEITQEITQLTTDGEVAYLVVCRNLKKVEEKTRVDTDATAAKVLHCQSAVHELERNLVKERVSIEIPVPMRIEYPSLEEVIYCKSLPLSDVENDPKDAKLRKRKPLPSSEVEEYLEFIEEGRLDGIEWDFGSFYPSSAQVDFLNSAVDMRNAALDEDREMEELERREAEEVRIEGGLICEMHSLLSINKSNYLY